MRALRLRAPVMAAASLAAIALSCAGAPPAGGSGETQAAERLFNAGNYAAAISNLQTVVSQSSSSAEGYYWLGRSYYEISDYDSAVAQAEKSVALDPKNSVYHQWLGRAYGAKADRDHSFSLAKKVKKEFQTAVSLNPSNIEARRDLEEYCLDAPWIVGGSKDEALEQVNAIAALDPVQGHLARAVYNREALKKPDDAEAEIRQVLAARPKSIDPYLEVANFFQAQDKPTDMAAAVQAASETTPNDPRLSYYHGVVAVLAGNATSVAERDLKSYLASTPDRSDWPPHAAAREWLGRLYESQGKRAEAAEQYRAALQLDPKRREAKARLAKLEKSQ
ncbi:MAG TPA: tetratricopeptide repeat protein [Verrucomicrobiae bacterium]|nr:tetratricopeptide repeat protein [Verrucomicrobiae bacterium]